MWGRILTILCIFLYFFSDQMNNENINCFGKPFAANGNEGNLILFLGNVYHFRNKWYSGSTMLLTLTRFRWKNESFVCLGRERKCSFTKMTNWNVQINGLSNTLCTRLTIKVIKLTKLRTRDFKRFLCIIPSTNGELCDSKAYDSQGWSALYIFSSRNNGA